MRFAPAKATVLRVAFTALSAAACLLPLSAQSPPAALPQVPTFTSRVNMLAVDVLVVDRDGQPILGLLPEDFSVSINRQARRIVSADLVHYSEAPRSPAVGSAPRALSSEPSSIIKTPGIVPQDSRVFAIAVDDASFSAGGIRPAMQAAQRFVDNLRPNDLVGLYVYPFERPRLDLTHDHRAVRAALGQLLGRRDNSQTSYSLTPAEIIDITGGDTDVLKRVQARECVPPFGQLPDPTCPDAIKGEANSLATYYESEAAQRIYGLGALIQDMGRLPGRKTVVVVSAGMMASDRIGARPSVRGFMGRLGEQAARANVTTYVVHLDETFRDMYAASRAGARRPTDYATSTMASEWAYASGLERLAVETGGVYVPVKGGTGDLAFGRVLRETMAYYLLGVEPTPDDWDGKKLVVQVKARAKGATVRALREVIAR